MQSKDRVPSDQDPGPPGADTTGQPARLVHGLAGACMPAPGASHCVKSVPEELEPFRPGRAPDRNEFAGEAYNMKPSDEDPRRQAAAGNHGL